MDLVLALADDAAHVVGVQDGAEVSREEVALADLPTWVASHEGVGVRWVWADSAETYAVLLRAGVRVRSGVDLLLTRAILRRAVAAAGTDYARAEPSSWDSPLAVTEAVTPPGQDEGVTLFDLPRRGRPVNDCVAEHLAQQACLREAADPALALLCHAESVGALIAQELNRVGVPFSAAAHDALLTELLGERDPHGGRPARMAALAGQVREILGDRGLNPDSPPHVVTALRRAGLDVESTRQWELQRLDHPVIEPLLAYKKLSRLHTANGWAWLQSWVRQDRFLPDWVAGGVVTGRWASRGGGALQLPKQIRGAVRAEPGWRLVVADAAQLEPRMLAAMSRDEAMARAATAGDLYQALVDQGVVETRQHAKFAMLGAMYGATTGEAGALMPRLRSAYPLAIGLVDAAAAAGERGEVVRTWLGRTSPLPPPSWHRAQQAAQEQGAGAGAERRARQAARDWGRFTRNFVVQGTAAEWALCWMGHLRRLLEETYGEDPGPGPELVYFLHDEVIVHTPAQHADEVAEAVREAAAASVRLLFGAFPVDVPLDVAVVESYDQA